jgi:hypothetical protein
MRENPVGQTEMDTVVPENEGETRAFSRRLNAAKEKWRNEYEQELMQKLRLVHPDTGEPLTRVEELMALLAEEEVPQGDPEMEALRMQLRRYQDEEEDRGLRGDAQLGEIYRRLYPEVEALAGYAREKGCTMGMKAAFQAVLLQHVGELLQEAGVRGRQQAMEELRRNARATPAALGGEAREEKPDYKRMSDAEFDRMLQRALNGELRKNI